MVNKKGFSAIEMLILIALMASVAMILVPRVLQEDFPARVSNIEKLAFSVADTINQTHTEWQNNGQMARLTLKDRVVFMTKDGWPEALDNHFEVNGIMTPKKCMNIINGLTELSFNMNLPENCNNNKHCEFKVTVSEDNRTCYFIENNYSKAYNVISYNIQNGQILVSTQRD